MIEQHKEESEVSYHPLCVYYIILLFYSQKMKTNLSDAETKFQEKEEDNKVIRDRLDSFKTKNNVRLQF